MQIQWNVEWNIAQIHFTIKKSSKIRRDRNVQIERLKCPQTVIPCFLFILQDLDVVGRVSIYVIPNNKMLLANYPLELLLSCWFGYSHMPFDMEFQDLCSDRFY